MKQETPNYKVRKVADGTRLEVSLCEKGADGLYHSSSCEYPLYLLVDVEKTYTTADGKTVKTTEKELVRQTRKQTEKYLLSCLGY